MAASRLPMHYWVGLAVKDVRMRLVAADRSFTQEHVAHEAGISLRHYQKIEAGTIDIRLSTLSEIARVLDEKPQRLLDRAESLLTEGRGRRR